VRPASKGKTVVSASEITKLLDNDPVILKTSDLATLRSNATITPSGPRESTKRSLEFQEKAKSRRDKMERHDREARLKKEDKTEAEKEEEERNFQLLASAARRMDEQKDDVKHMSSMMQYAKCVTIRDAQILEKQQIQQQLAEEERRLDLMMDVERVKNIKLTQEQERQRAVERKQGAMVIIHQIAEREADRVRQQELREQEAKAMLERLQIAELREAEAQQRKKDAGRRLLQDVLSANEQQARAKLLKKQEALEEDMQIAEYVRQKELREQAAERDAARLRADKEKEIGRMRALQEKAQDRQSMIDELRAKRYQEQKDRQAREKQLEAARKKEQVLSELTQAREAQRQVEASRMAEQAMLEREEYYRVLEFQKQQMEIDQQKHYEQQRQRNKHREALMEQINEHEAAKTEARYKFLEDGQRTAAEMAAEHRRLNQLKQEKLDELGAVGVPEKYRAELAKKKVLVATIY